MATNLDKGKVSFVVHMALELQYSETFMCTSHVFILLVFVSCKAEMNMLADLILGFIINL